MKIVQNFGDSENLMAAVFPIANRDAPSACKLATCKANSRSRRSSNNRFRGDPCFAAFWYAPDGTGGKAPLGANRRIQADTKVTPMLVSHNQAPGCRQQAAP